MERINYIINKGVNRPVEFRGLKGQYIYILAIGLAALLIVFSILYIAKVPAYLLLAVVGIAGFGLFTGVYRLSHRFGEFGLMKTLARRQVPFAIFCLTRRTIEKLSEQISEKENVKSDDFNINTPGGDAGSRNAAKPHL
ncbi:DUF4133 domain-containing protein [Chitinophaga sp. OAE865]|uniref:DUF4133 domain-containing protein n=1 Tax=Chitinophaga sp. OAE865 TaxID=2817898 RepID=UPI001AE9781C